MLAKMIICLPVKTLFRFKKNNQIAGKKMSKKMSKNVKIAGNQQLVQTKQLSVLL